MALRISPKWLGNRNRKQRASRHRHNRPALTLEHLEIRATPAVLTWDGGAGNLDWLNRFNWSTDTLPTLADDVTISGAAGAVEINNTFGVGAARSLVSDSGLRIITGTLQLAKDSVIHGDFTLGGNVFDATINGSGNLRLTGNVVWLANGVMAGTGKTILEGTASLTGNTFGSIRANRLVENAGSATIVAGSSFNFRDAAVWHNLAGSTLNFSSGAGIGSFFASPASKLINEGTMNFSGPGTTAVAVFTENLGTLTVSGGNVNLTGLKNSGAVQLIGGNLSTGSSLENTSTITVSGGNLTVGPGTSSGAVELSNGATMIVRNTAFTPPFTLLDGATVSGGPIVLNTFEQLGISGIVAADAIRLSGGTLNGFAGSSLTVDTLEQNGTVTGPGDVTVTDQWSFTGGTLTGSGRMVTEGTSTFSGGFFATIDGRTVENSGVATVMAGGLRFSNAARWTNQPGSVLELSGSAGISNFFSSGMVDNAGTLRKTGAVGNVSTIGVQLINTGRMEILGGDLTTGANSRSSGVTDIASGGRWVLNTGLTTLEAGASTTGAGVLLIQGGSLTVTGAASIARLQQNSFFTTVTVNAPLTIGDYIFNAGTLTGTGRTTLTGQSSFTGFSSRTISNHIVDNAGTLRWSQNGTIQLANSVFNNLAGATFDIDGDGRFNSAGGTPAFHNAGTLRKSGGNGFIGPFALGTTWGVPLSNSGTLDVRTGNFHLSTPIGLPASVPMLANGGTIRIGTDSSSAAGITLPTIPGSPPTYTLAGGSLTGTGQVFVGPFPGSNLVIGPEGTLGGTLTIHGNVVNRGTVQPGSTAGSLTVTGNYTQVDDSAADGRLVIGLRGDSGSGLFGKLTVNGSSQLAGALEVFAEGGFLPDFGDVFQVFRTIGSRSGDFTYPEGGYDLDGYRVLTPQYDGSGLRLNLETEVGPLPVIDPIDDVTVNEGETVAFTATVSGAEPPGPLTFSLATGSSPGATIDAATGAFEFFAAAGPGEYIFQVAASDPNAPTDPVDVETFKVTVLNVAPVVTIAGGQAELDEGDQFTASGSFTDPGADSWTATVDYGDGTGVTPLTLNPDMTFALDHHYLGDGQFTITVRVFDGHEYGTATFEVAVANVAPVVAVNGPSSGVRGQVRTFTLSATDPSAVDQLAGFTFSIDWGDGTFQQVTGLSGTQVEHTFTDAGGYVVTVTATDEDGGVSQAATHEISVVVAEVQDGVLVVGGTTGADQIQVKRGTSSDSLEITINGQSLGEIAGLTRAVVYGQAGDDQLDATGSTDVALELYGGAGNDHLKGGSKDDILDGGTGDDELIGGLGRDILIGGAGADRVISQSGDDILIGGLFMGSELTEARRAALLAVSAEWSSDRSFSERVEALIDDLTARIQDDGVADSLTGSSGSDWYFAHNSGEADELDTVNGAASGDVITTI